MQGSLSQLCVDALVPVKLQQCSRQLVFHCVAAVALGSCVALLLCRCCKTGQQPGADPQKLELTALLVIVYQPASSMSAWSALEFTSCRVAFAGLIVGYLAVIIGGVSSCSATHVLLSLEVLQGPSPC